jgi:hypothetical protein
MLPGVVAFGLSELPPQVILVWPSIEDAVSKWRKRRALFNSWRGKCQIPDLLGCSDKGRRTSSDVVAQFIRSCSSTVGWLGALNQPCWWMFEGVRWRSI